jgi:zinc transporter 2
LDAAFLHALGDMLMSVGVVIAGTIIWIEPTWTYADPCCTFIFSISVLCTTGPILRKCMLVLMEGAPPSIDAKDLVKNIKRVSGCRSIHDFHIWSISNNKYAISAHIDCDNVLKALKSITEMLRETYDIDHITL